ncbi:MAG: hypothetical protein L3J66_08360 [Bacteroidales bacterium]|nr:hypothetical protein [Bacteroidales bacterium]
MFSNLILSSPWWTVIPVILTGLIYAGLLYFRNKGNKISFAWTTALFLFRFFAVSLLAFLLLSPFLRTKKKVVEKPVVAFAFDNSGSMVLGNDSTYLTTQMYQRAQQAEDLLSKGYKVDQWVFSEQTTLNGKVDFSGEVSDYAQMLHQLDENYKGANVGALVVFGDGIFNRGIDPLYAASEINFPIYTVALGDTGVNRDLKINDVRFNSLVYLGDRFPIEVNLNANEMKGENATLRIFAFGKQVATKTIRIGSNYFNKSYHFELEAKQQGKQRIRISVETDSSEVSRENNRRSIFIEVLNNRKKVLIVAYAPHPDLGALKQSIEKTRNYQADIQYADKLTAGTADYDLVVLHQLPSRNFKLGLLLATLKKEEIPVLFVLGKQSSITLFNSNFKGLSIQSAVGSFEEAQADINSDFSLFTFPSELGRQLESLPPLRVPLGNYKLSPGTSVFAYQEIKRIATDFPLLAFSDDAGRRTGVITGEGLWLWRIHNYLAEANTSAFDDFIDKTVQLLMARKDKRHFRVITKGTYPSYQNVVISAELYNSAFEAVNNVEVNLRLTNEAGEQFNYLFSAYDQNYRLDLKQLPEGVYRYHAQTRLGTKQYRANGEFVVSSESLESRKLQANHRMLFRLADEHGGKMLYPGETETLPALLSKRDDQASRVYYEEHFTALHTLAAVLLLILLLLSLEWFLRKYFGSY